MAIATNDGIWKFGTQDEVTSGVPLGISSDTFGLSDQGASVNWTNTDNSPYGSAVLMCDFVSTMPTAGHVGLYARLLDIQGTNDPGAPDVSNPVKLVGIFEIDFGAVANVDFYMAIDTFAMPGVGDAQAIDWYLKNDGTGQQIGPLWQLWITPKAIGPAA